MAAADKLNHKLQESLLLMRPRHGDSLQLPDAILLAALNGSRPLRASERQLLQASPLTLRRFKFLALQARQAQLHAGSANQWQASSGQVLAAASQGPQAFQLISNDQCWQLDVFPSKLADANSTTDSGTDSGTDSNTDAAPVLWQMLLRLHPSAPFASQVLQQACVLQVLDGMGNVLMEGALDSDAELQAPWPEEFANDAASRKPLAHFASHGGSFTVQKRE